jgi:flagellar hook-associated protein 3 FlgL
MIRGLDGASEKFLADLARMQSASERAQRQIASGLRVERPSDSPGEASVILQLGTRVDRLDQVQKNLALVKNETDVAETTLQQAIRVTERVMVLAAQGAGGLRSAADRLAIANELRGLQEQMVGLSRTSVAGRFLFSGDRDQEPAYSLNWSSAGAVDRAFTAPATRQIEDADGVTFAPALTAQDIFDARQPDDSAAAGNVFRALNDLRVALEADDEAGIDAAQAAVRSANDHLNRQLSFYGGVQNRVAGAIQRAQQLSVQERTALSDLRDTDLPAAALELSQARLHQEAAMSAQARGSRSSLFDYLA